MQVRTAQAAIFAKAGKPLEVRSYPVTAPKGDMALLALKLNGICGTDIHIIEGRLPIPPAFIPGHEFIGTVEALGPRAKKDGLGRPIGVGDMVIACVADPCGKCFNCRQGETANCLHFGVTNIRDPKLAPHLFGGFAEMLYQPAATLVRVPKGLSVEAVAAFPCAGPTAIHGFGRAGGLKKDEIVIVQGTGPVGLFAIARTACCRVAAIGSGTNPARMAMARKLGAEKVWDYRAGTSADRLAEVKAWAAKFKRGDGADVVFEASGSPTAIPEGLGLVRTLGRYIVPGQYSSSGTVAISPEAITFKAVTVVGSSQYALADIGAYLTFPKKHPRLQSAFAACITNRYRVADAVRACADASAGRAIKAVFAGVI
ncbi:MAG: alcohol dehydrogenase catalytic domain-containing protein [Planctomycetota bacterium]